MKKANAWLKCKSDPALGERLMRSRLIWVLDIDCHIASDDYNASLVITAVDTRLPERSDWPLSPLVTLTSERYTTLISLSLTI